MDILRTAGSTPRVLRSVPGFLLPRASVFSDRVPSHMHMALFGNCSHDGSHDFDATSWLWAAQLAERILANTEPVKLLSGSASCVGP